MRSGPGDASADERRAQRLGRAQLLTAAALFSTGGAAIKGVDLSGWQIACFRSLVAAAFLGLVVALTRRSGAAGVWRRLLDPRVLRVSLAYAGTVLLFATANKLTTSANAIFLQSTAPLYLLFVGPWLLKERARGADLALMAPLAAGLALVFFAAEPAQRTAPDPVLGNVLALGAGVSWAFTLTGLRWLERQSDFAGNGATTVLTGNLLAGLIGLPLALGAGLPSAGAVDWALLGYLGVVQIGVAYLLVTRGLGRVPALEASLLVLAEPALNPVWAWLVHGERPAPLALAGGALILAATVTRGLLGARQDAADADPGTPAPPATPAPPTPAPADPARSRG